MLVATDVGWVGGDTDWKWHWRYCKTVPAECGGRWNGLPNPTARHLRDFPLLHDCLGKAVDSFTVIGYMLGAVGGFRFRRGIYEDTIFISDALPWRMQLRCGDYDGACPRRLGLTRLMTFSAASSKSS